MSIKANTSQMQSKASNAASIASQLKEKVNQVNNMYYSLDSKVKRRQGIDESIHSLRLRMEKAQEKMYNISVFLGKAAEQYNIAENIVVARSAGIGAATSNNGGVEAGVIKVGAYIGAAQGKVEGKKWYQSNWFKIAVGAVVVGAAVAAAITVGGPILIGIAVGAAIGGGIGALTGGVVSKMTGGSFVEGAADGFMWGAVGGAFSGGIGAAGAGIVGAAAAEGAVNSAVYAGQTLQNGGDVTWMGLAANFAVGAGFSALGTVVSNKMSGTVSRGVDEFVKKAAEATERLKYVCKYAVDELPNVVKRVTGFTDEVVEVDLGYGITQIVRVSEDVTDKPGFFSKIKGIISGEEIMDVDFGSQFTKVSRRTTLKPKVRYTTPEGYRYTTDEFGRINKVEALELKLGEAPRNEYAQRTVGWEDRLPDDDGGHLIGNQFMGSGELDNLIPMNLQINRSGGKWYNMETEWRNALNEIPPRKVSVKIDPVYSGESSRPVSFNVKYTIEDEYPRIVNILNQAGG